MGASTRRLEMVLEPICSGRFKIEVKAVISEVICIYVSVPEIGGG